MATRLSMMRYGGMWGNDECGTGGSSEDTETRGRANEKTVVARHSTRVSVLMPAFEQSEFVRRAMDSLLAQTLEGWNW